MEKINRDDSYSVVSYCDNRDIVCFNCKKHGHYAWACPKKIVRRIRVILEIEAKDKSIIEEFEECLKRRRVTRHIIQKAPPNEFIFLLFRKLNRSKYFMFNTNLDKYIEQRMEELDDKVAEKYEKGAWKKEEIQKQVKEQIIEEEIATDYKGLTAENDPLENKKQKEQARSNIKVAAPKPYKIQTKIEKDTKKTLAVNNEKKKKIKELEEKERTLLKQIQEEKESWFYVSKSKINDLEDQVMDVRMDKAVLEGELLEEQLPQETSSPNYTRQIKPCSLPAEEIKKKVIPAPNMKEEIKKDMKKKREMKIKKGKFNNRVRQEYNEKQEKANKVKELKEMLASMDEEEKREFMQQKREEKQAMDEYVKSNRDGQDVNYDLQL